MIRLLRTDFIALAHTVSAIVGSQRALNTVLRCSTSVRPFYYWLTLSYSEVSEHKYYIVIEYNLNHL